MSGADAARVVTVYSRKGCHLCEVLIEELLPVLRDRWPLEVIDIDTDPDLRQLYNERVPVVAVDGTVLCQYKLDLHALRSALENDSAPPGASPQS